MRGWRVKGRDKLDFRASADSIKYHGMYENEYGSCRSRCSYTCILDLNLRTMALEMRQKACAIIMALDLKYTINGGKTQHST